METTEQKLLKAALASVNYDCEFAFKGMAVNIIKSIGVKQKQIDSLLVEITMLRTDLKQMKLTLVEESAVF